MTSNGMLVARIAGPETDPRSMWRTPEISLPASVVKSCHNLRVHGEHHTNTHRQECATVSKRLDNLAETHSCVMALLDSRILSPTTRLQLELFRQHIEHEIIRFKEPPDVAAD